MSEVRRDWDRPGYDTKHAIPRDVWEKRQEMLLAKAEPRGLATGLIVDELATDRVMIGVDHASGNDMTVIRILGCGIPKALLDELTIRIQQRAMDVAVAACIDTHHSHVDDMKLGMAKLRESLMRASVRDFMATASAKADSDHDKRQSLRRKLVGPKRSRWG